MHVFLILITSQEWHVWGSFHDHQASSAGISVPEKLDNVVQSDFAFQPPDPLETLLSLPEVVVPVT